MKSSWLEPGLSSGRLFRRTRRQAQSVAGRVLAASAVIAALVVATVAGPAPSAEAQTSRTVMVHLFEWTWPDIAVECETFLGPNGFAAVQVSPPNEHTILGGYPWYQRYQPVSYQLESRSGTRAEFVDMVQRCDAAGVDIYVDAVINHMADASDGGRTSGPNTFDRGAFGYPGVPYGYNDFHHCGRNGNDDIANYNDRYEVQNCELVNLPDLDTGSTWVRDRLGDYLNDLVDIGVAGFRLDASKHMAASDIDAILDRVDGSPYVFQEVIDLGGEAISATEYQATGDVTEFKYSAELGRVFKAGQLSWLEFFGPAWGFLPSVDAVVFVDNHDNQRGHGAGGANIVTFKDGDLYDLANVFMLGWPYGYPKVMSSYDFGSESQGPPSDASGNTSRVHQSGKVNCFNQWQCEHRRPAVANMVEFRNVTAADFFVTDWWSDGNNRIAFGRGDSGFVAINRDGGAFTRTYQTSMPAGSYCNVVDGEPTAGGCSAGVITVDGSGQATIGLDGVSAAAIHIGARAGGS